MSKRAQEGERESEHKRCVVVVRIIALGPCIAMSYL